MHGAPPFCQRETTFEFLFASPTKKNNPNTGVMQLMHYRNRVGSRGSCETPTSPTSYVCFLDTGFTVLRDFQEYFTYVEPIIQQSLPKNRIFWKEKKFVSRTWLAEVCGQGLNTQQWESRRSYSLGPGCVAQSVGHLTRKSEVLGSIPGLATYFRFSFL